MPTLKGTEVSLSYYNVSDILFNKCLYFSYYMAGYLLYRLYIMKYDSAIKKNEIVPCVTTGMNVEWVMLSEISQREKNKYYKISFISGT